jgi:hypothetical protein
MFHSKHGVPKRDRCLSTPSPTHKCPPWRETFVHHCCKTRHWQPNLFEDLVRLVFTCHQVATHRITQGAVGAISLFPYTSGERKLRLETSRSGYMVNGFWILPAGARSQSTEHTNAFLTSNERSRVMAVTARTFIEYKPWAAITTTKPLAIPASI